MSSEVLVNKEEKEYLEVEILKVRFQKKTNFGYFSIFTIKRPEDIPSCKEKRFNHLISVSGESYSSLQEGDFVSFKSRLYFNEQYGYQLNPKKSKSSIKKQWINTEIGFFNYLKTYKGLGPKKSKTIFTYFDDNDRFTGPIFYKTLFENEIKNENEDLIKILGKNLFNSVYNELISKLELEEKEERSKPTDEEIEFAQEYDLSSSFVNSIKKAGLNLITTITENIYRIRYDRKISGKGFLSVNKLANKLFNDEKLFNDKKEKISDEEFKKMQWKGRFYYSLIKREEEGHSFLMEKGIFFFLKQLKDNIKKEILEEVKKDHQIKFQFGKRKFSISEDNDTNNFIGNEIKLFVNKSFIVFYDRLGPIYEINNSEIVREFNKNKVVDSFDIPVEEIYNFISKDLIEDKVISIEYVDKENGILEYVNNDPEKIKFIGRNRDNINEIDDKRYLKYRFYLSRNYFLESSVSSNIAKRILLESKNLNDGNFSFDEGFTPSPMQKLAIEKRLSSNIMVLTGGPGTGKTTISKYIYKELTNKGFEVLLMAPTGTRAKRISQVIGCSRKTIHRAIGFNGMGGKPKFNLNNPLPCDVVMIDESSMLDLKILDTLLKAIDYSTKIIFIGDVDQLMSVGVGKVLEDLITSKKIDVVKLDRVYRQRQENPIVDFAYNVNNFGQEGEPFFFFKDYVTRSPNISKKLNVFIHENFSRATFVDDGSCVGDHLDFIENEIIKLTCDYYDEHSIENVRILTQRKAKIKCSSDSLNLKIQSKINPNNFIPGTKFKVNDKVIQIRNNYDKNIFNGSIGFIKYYDEQKNIITIEFDDGNESVFIEYNVKKFIPKGSKEKVISLDNDVSKNIDLAYAITIHKSQGQEFKCVVLVVNDSFLINKKIIYTGITRRRDYATVVSSRNSLCSGIKTKEGKKSIDGKWVYVSRNSGLKEKIQNKVDFPEIEEEPIQIPDEEFPDEDLFH